MFLLNLISDLFCFLTHNSKEYTDLLMTMRCVFTGRVLLDMAKKDIVQANLCGNKFWQSFQLKKKRAKVNSLTPEDASQFSRSEFHQFDDQTIEKETDQCGPNKGI